MANAKNILARGALLSDSYPELNVLDEKDHCPQRTVNEFMVDRMPLYLWAASMLL
jgi:hypothetical protein